MKDCCKTGDEKPQKKDIGKMMTWLIYVIVIGLLAFIVINQINY